MRLFLSRSLSIAIIAVMPLALSACASQPAESASKSARSAGKTATSDAARTARAGQAKKESSAGAVEEETDEYAQRLIAAMEASKRRQQERAAAEEVGTDTPLAAGPVAQVQDDAKSRTAKPAAIHWVEPGELRSVELAKPKAEAQAGAVNAGNADVAGAANADSQGNPTATAKPAADAKPASDLDRETLVKLLRQRIAESGDSDAGAALSYAALSLADPTFKLDPAELNKMKPSQRELARQFYDLFSTLGQQVAAGQAVDRAALSEKINAIVGEQPVSLRSVKLCERVRGFGVFEELPSDTFLAGREHPMVVYVEVDHFKSLLNAAGSGHQVKLSQELVLYSVSDGLAVWQQPEENIVDESRNKRRDFFIVQPTRLPARLGVGKYVLKVRVRDLQGGTRDEVSVPINVVADPTLVRPAVKGAEKRG